MQYTSSVLLSAAGLAATVSAHGQISSPKPRVVGDAMKAACGAQVYSMQSSDSYGNVQGELQIAASQSDFNAAECNVWLCKGYQFSDNTNIFSYTAGEVIPVTVDIRAPHTGTANVSIVETASNTMISSTLAYWDVYASTATGVSANDTSFSITMPDVSDKCSTAGACVIQWWWNAASIDQTYESCIDFTMGGSGSGSSSNTTVAASTSAAAPAATSSDAVMAMAAKVATPSGTPTTMQTVVSTPTGAAATSTPSSDSSTTEETTEMPAGTTFKTLVSWLSSMLASGTTA